MTALRDDGGGVSNTGSGSAASAHDNNGRAIYYTDGRWYYGDGSIASGPGSPPPPQTTPAAPDDGGSTKTTPSSGSGDRSTSAAPPAPPPTDWSLFLGTYAGMDGYPGMVDALNKIWRDSNGNSSVATPLIQNYVMGTQWFKDNYPGYSQGINHGMYSDIRGYVSYQNDIYHLYNQYYGRAPTSAELSGYLSSGDSAALVSSKLQSSALQGTISDPLKAIFTPDELKAYTDERSGIDTALGQKMLGEVTLYTQVQPLFNSFYNRAPTRGELDTLTANGTDPSQVSQQFKASGYLDAINPVLKNLFSGDELQQMANEAAGGDTQHGKQLLDMANLASSLNEVYQVHYGASVTRDELNLAYTQGYTAQHVDAMLSSGEYAASLPANVKALFTPDELKQAGEQASGFSSSDNGARLLGIVKGAGDYAKLAGQYGETLNGDQLKEFYDKGTTANDYGNQLAGKAFAKANEGDIQQVAGSFGGGQLTPEQLQSLGQEKTGYDTPQGQQLLASFNKAQQRMAGAFGQTLARLGDFSGLQSRKQINEDTSDVAA